MIRSLNLPVYDLITWNSWRFSPMKTKQVGQVLLLEEEY